MAKGLSGGVRGGFKGLGKGISGGGWKPSGSGSLSKRMFSSGTKKVSGTAGGTKAGGGVGTAGSGRGCCLGCALPALLIPLCLLVLLVGGAVWQG